MTFVLILSVILSVLNACLNPLVKWVLCKCFPKIAVASRTELNDIRQQMASLSKVDDFAKYIRLERQMNKIIENRKLEVQAHIDFRKKTIARTGYVLQAVLTLTCVTLFWTQRGIPVIVLPADWFYPFGEVFSWPTNVPGGISFPVWFMITNTVAKLMTKQLL